MTLPGPAGDLHKTPSEPPEDLHGSCMMASSKAHPGSVRGAMKGGRPPIDPQIAERARTLRMTGASWTAIARKLSIGRTTAREAVNGKHSRGPVREFPSEAEMG